MHDPRAPGAPEAARAPGGTVVIGVLGGIASGKSTVARLLAGDDGVVLDADRVAHAALGSDSVLKRVVERFGAGVLDREGRPDRAALARVVFDDPEARKALEDWIHPIVRAKLWAELEAARERGVPRVVLDVPLLIENDPQHGLLDACDHVVFVVAPLQDRDARATSTRGWEPGEVARRERSQMPLDEKRAFADLHIDNHGDAAALERAVRRLAEGLSPRPS